MNRRGCGMRQPSDIEAVHVIMESAPCLHPRWTCARRPVWSPRHRSWNRRSTILLLKEHIIITNRLAPRRLIGGGDRRGWENRISVWSMKIVPLNCVRPFRSDTSLAIALWPGSQPEAASWYLRPGLNPLIPEYGDNKNAPSSSPLLLLPSFGSRPPCTPQATGRPGLFRSGWGCWISNVRRMELSHDNKRVRRTLGFV